MSWINSVLCMPFRDPTFGQGLEDDSLKVVLMDYSPRRKIATQKETFRPVALRTSFPHYYGVGLWKNASGRPNQWNSMLFDPHPDFNVLSEDFEVSLWIRPSYSTATETWLPLLTHCGRFEFTLHSPAGDALAYPAFRVVTGSECISTGLIQPNWADLVTTVESAVGQDLRFIWAHVRVSHTAGMLRFYMNGNQVGPAVLLPGAFNPAFVNCPMMLGGFGSLSVDPATRYPGGMFDGIMTDLEFLVGEATTSNFTPPGPLTGTFGGSIDGGVEREFSVFHGDTGQWFYRAPILPSGSPPFGAAPHEDRYRTAPDGSFKIVLPMDNTWDVMVESGTNEDCQLWVPHLLPEDIDS